MTIRSPVRLALLAAVVGWSLFGGIPSIQAQSAPENKTIAESLFREGRRLMDEKKVNEACRKFEESMRLDPAPGTLLNLAVCHQQEGKIATAWGEFNEALVQAKKDKRPDREQLARDSIAEIEPRLPKLSVEVTPEARLPGLEVLRNGIPLGQGAWGVAIPVDPGDVAIEARAPKYKSWKSVLRIAEKEEKRIAIPALEPLPEPAVVVAPPPVPASVAVVTPATQPPSGPVPFWNGTRTAGAFLGGVGIIAVGVGAAFGVAALQKRSDSDAFCSGDRCTSQHGVDLNNDARRNARIADLGIGLGAVALAAGGVLFFTAGNERTTAATPKRHLGLSLSLHPETAGAGVYGAW